MPFIVIGFVAGALPYAIWYKGHDVTAKQRSILALLAATRSLELS
jgi:hypothetical protein